MRKALLVFLLLTSLLLLAFAVTGCDSTATNPPTNQFAFLRYSGGNFAAQFAARGEGTKAARAAAWAARHSSARRAVAATATEILPGPIDVYTTSTTSTPGAETKVTDVPSSIESAFLSRDGRKGVFTGLVTGSDSHDYLQVFVVNMSNPTNAVQVTSDLEDHYDAQFSPDGNTIVFSYYDGNSEWDDYLGTVPAAGGSETKSFEALAGMDVLNPTYTPDGQKIVFEDCNSDNLYIVNATGTGLTQLTDTGYDRIPSVSPDGTKIVFERETNGSEIYIMGIDGEMGGTAATPLTGPSVNPPTMGAVSFEPMFIGDKIVFVTDLDDDNDIDIYAMNADGSGKVAITDTAEDDFFSGYTLYW